MSGDRKGLTADWAKKEGKLDAPEETEACEGV